MKEVFVLQILFKCFGPIRRVCGSSEINLEIEPSFTVMNVIHQVIDQFGLELANLLLDGDQVSGNFIIMLNKRDINTLDGFDTHVQEGDELAILPHVQGGR